MNHPLSIGNDMPDRQSTERNERLRRALAERDRFLQRQPHLRVYQAEIDRLLDRSGNQQGRLAVLALLTQGKLLDMQRELTSLSELLKHARRMQ